MQEGEVLCGNDKMSSDYFIEVDKRWIKEVFIDENLNIEFEFFINYDMKKLINQFKNYWSLEVSGISINCSKEKEFNVKTVKEVEADVRASFPGTDIGAGIKKKIASEEGSKVTVKMGDHFWERDFMVLGENDLETIKSKRFCNKDTRMVNDDVPVSFYAVRSILLNLNPAFFTKDKINIEVKKETAKINVRCKREFFVI